LEKERTYGMPQRLRYPLFLAGLLIIILGNLGAHFQNLGAGVAAPLSVLGFVLVVISVAIR
jgi:hypothetical protein